MVYFTAFFGSLGPFLGGKSMEIRFASEKGLVCAKIGRNSAWSNHEIIWNRMKSKGIVTLSFVFYLINPAEIRHGDMETPEFIDYLPFEHLHVKKPSHVLSMGQASFWFNASGIATVLWLVLWGHPRFMWWITWCPGLVPENGGLNGQTPRYSAVNGKTHQKMKNPPIKPQDIMISMISMLLEKHEPFTH